jgi:hypothetical protein
MVATISEVGVNVPNASVMIIEVQNVLVYLSYINFEVVWDESKLLYFDDEP